jgi:hypothetical protein
MMSHVLSVAIESHGYRISLTKRSGYVLTALNKTKKAGSSSSLSPLPPYNMITKYDV